MIKIDLSPFGYTPTESLVYSALLTLGPSTGYGVAQATRLARANAYAALEGLVSRGAAVRSPGRPLRFRPADPQALIAKLAAVQGEAIDRLSRSLKDATRLSEPETRVVTGLRAAANLVHQLVARAERSVRGVMAAELWRPTLPAWRRAAARAEVTVWLAGDGAGEDPLFAGVMPPDAPAILVIDDGQVITTNGTGEQLDALWSSHPLIVRLATLALAQRTES